MQAENRTVVRNTLAFCPRREDGFALIEMFMGASVFVVGALALMTMLLTSARVSEDARVRSRARDASLSAIEEFRNKCLSGFAAAVSAYSGREVTVQSIAVGKDSSKLRTDVAFDETALSPPMDLNGDGDTLDKVLTANELAVVCLTTNVTWQKGKQSERFATIMARGDVASPGDRLPGPPKAPETQPEITLTSSTVGATSLTAAVTTTEEVHFSGMTIHSSEPAYVKQIRIDGKDVFKQAANLPPTGQMIVTSPFTMAAGNHTIDTVAFAGSPSGAKTDVSEATMSIVFHTEAGDRLLVIK